jgi:preprotein translocase subunit SecE
MGKVGEFYSEVKQELKKVTWTSKDATIGTTAVVIVLVVIFSVFLGVVDIGLSKIIRTIIG